MSEHDWLLVAPAWSWDPETPARGTVPALQKYDTSDPVQPFTADPTRSLPFEAEDLVYDASPRLADTFVRTDIRKLYLDTHNSKYGKGWKREEGFVASGPPGLSMVRKTAPSM